MEKADNMRIGESGLKRAVQNFADVLDSQTKIVFTGLSGTDILSNKGLRKVKDKEGRTQAFSATSLDGKIYVNGSKDIRVVEGDEVIKSFAPEKPVSLIFGLNGLGVLVLGYEDGSISYHTPDGRKFNEKRLTDSAISAAEFDGKSVYLGSKKGEILKLSKEMKIEESIRNVYGDEELKNPLKIRKLVINGDNLVALANSIWLFDKNLKKREVPCTRLLGNTDHLSYVFVTDIAAYGKGLLVGKKNVGYKKLVLTDNLENDSSRDIALKIHGLANTIPKLIETFSCNGKDYAVVVFKLREGTSRYIYDLNSERKKEYCLYEKRDVTFIESLRGIYGTYNSCASSLVENILGDLSMHVVR